MNNRDIEKILEILMTESSKWNAPVKVLKRRTSDPFKVLIGAIISTRTKDEVTAEVVERLFSHVKRPEDFLSMSETQIASLIYPCGFYRTKARAIKGTAKTILEAHGGKVPETMEELLKLPGVGRKVANIVLSRVYGKKAIAVDTHVFRISNRLGLVAAKKPVDAERELLKVLPESWHKEFNELLVAFGQVICRPVKPKCDQCPIERYCPKIGVRIERKN